MAEKPRTCTAPNRNFSAIKLIRERLLNYLFRDIKMPPTCEHTNKLHVMEHEYGGAVRDKDVEGNQSCANCNQPRSFEKITGFNKLRSDIESVNRRRIGSMRI